MEFKNHNQILIKGKERKNRTGDKDLIQKEGHWHQKIIPFYEINKDKEIFEEKNIFYEIYMQF